MIAGEEGGGCTGEIGHYIGFAGVTPEGLTVSIPIQSFIWNTTLAQSYIPRDDTGPTLPLWQLMRLIGDAPLPGPRRKRGSATPYGAPDSIPGQRMVSSPQIQSNPYFLTTPARPSTSRKSLVPLIQAVSKGATTPKNKRAHCIPLLPVALPAIKKPKVKATPVIEGEPLIDTALVIAVTPAGTTSGKGVKRNKSAAPQIVEPQPTPAPVEVAALSAL